ncbi:MCE family protein, partial [Streptomyces sp. NPDC006356]
MRVVSRKGGALAWAAVGSLLLSGCEFNGWYDVQLPGGAASDGDAYHVTVEFRDVLDLVPQSAVKVNNVTVGAVEKVELDGWHARVRLRVADSVKLPANATAELHQTSMLGEKYVALSRPAGTAPVGRLTDGAVIPLSRSGRNPEIEEVLSALSALLNGGGVAQLKTITVELNKALEGRENRVKSLLKELNVFLGGLDEQKRDIVRALKAVDRLAGRLGKEKKTI